MKKLYIAIFSMALIISSCGQDSAPSTTDENTSSTTEQSDSTDQVANSNEEVENEEKEEVQETPEEPAKPVVENLETGIVGTWQLVNVKGKRSKYSPCEKSTRYIFTEESAGNYKGISAKRLHIKSNGNPCGSVYLRKDEKRIYGFFRGELVLDRFNYADGNITGTYDAKIVNGQLIIKSLSSTFYLERVNE